jgi:S-adenosyl methyltransferase
VVYVDIDPVAVAEGLEILDDNEHATSIRGTVLDIPDVLAHPSVVELIDFTRPVAVILCAVLHFVTDDDAVRTALDQLRAVSVPDSYLILSHGTRPDADVAAEDRARFAADDQVMQDVYASRTTTPVRMRGRSEIETYFRGYGPVDPGLTWVGDWRPDGAYPDEFGGNARLASILGGVGVRT